MVIWGNTSKVVLDVNPDEWNTLKERLRDSRFEADGEPVPVYHDKGGSPSKSSVLVFGEIPSGKLSAVRKICIAHVLPSPLPPLPITVL